MDVGVALSGLLGLLGVVVGAVLTAVMQARAARLTREAVQDDAAHRAVRELFAASDVLAGLYEGVWQLDRGKNHPPPEAAYTPAVEAWVEFQRARSGVLLAAPETVHPATVELSAALNDEVGYIEVYYQRGGGAHQLTDDEVQAFAARRGLAEKRIRDELHRAIPLPSWPRPRRSWRPTTTPSGRA